MMESFCKIIKSEKPLTALAKSSIIDIQLGPKYVFENYLTYIVL